MPARPPGRTAAAAPTPPPTNRTCRGLGDLARPLVAHLVAAQQLPDFSVPEPLRLALDVRGDPVARRAGARELALGGHPAAASTSTRPGSTRAAARGRAPATAVRFSVLPGVACDLRRVDQAVAAHPDAVARLRQVGEEVAPAIVGDHDPRELRRQVRGLRDDPDAGLRPSRSGDHAADVVGVDGDRRAAALPFPRPGQGNGNDDRAANRQETGRHKSQRLHGWAPLDGWMVSDLGRTWSTCHDAAREVTRLRRSSSGSQ